MQELFSVSGGIQGIVDRFPKVFSRVGKLSGYQLKLHIDPEVRPVVQKPRRIPYPFKEKVQQRASAQLFVSVCVDMRCASEAIQRKKIPIPTMDEVLQELNEGTVFPKLDINMGFHQTELEEGYLLFRYKRMSFGINNAPEQYQNILRQTTAGCPGATNIEDDIVVHGKTTEEHDRNVVALLNRLQERNLTLNKDK